MFQAKNADFFKHYVTEDFNTYLQRKLQSVSHGNHIEIQAMCELYSRPIEVYQYALGKNQAWIYTREAPESETNVIHCIYDNL